MVRSEQDPQISKADIDRGFQASPQLEEAYDPIQLQNLRDKLARSTKPTSIARLLVERLLEAQGKYVPNGELWSYSRKRHVSESEPREIAKQVSDGLRNIIWITGTNSFALVHLFQTGEDKHPKSIGFAIVDKTNVAVYKDPSLYEGRISLDPVHIQRSIMRVRIISEADVITARIPDAETNKSNERSKSPDKMLWRHVLAKSGLLETIVTSGQMTIEELGLLGEYFKAKGEPVREVEDLLNRLSIAVARFG